MTAEYVSSMVMWRFFSVNMEGDGMTEKRLPKRSRLPLCIRGGLLYVFEMDSIFENARAFSLFERLSKLPAR